MVAATNTVIDESLDVPAVVRPLRRKLAARLVAQRGSRAVAICLAGVAAIVLFCRLSPWPSTLDAGDATLLAVIYALVVLVGTGIRIAVEWPSVQTAIRHADRVLLLKNRLATAYEFGSRPGRIVSLQLAELQDQLKTTRLADAVDLRLSRRQIAGVVASLLLVVVAVLAPGHRTATEGPAAQARNSARQAQASTSSLLKRLGLQATSTKATTAPQSRAERQIKQVLQTLQKQLGAAQSQQTALKALSSAQDQLQKLATGAAQAKTASLGIASALRQGATQSVAQAMQSGNSVATKQTLQSLAQRLASMSPQQQATTARALKKAANQAPAALKQSLRQAAFDLTDNNPAAAKSALATAATQAAQLQQQANASSSAQQAVSGVQNIQNTAANGTQDNSAIDCSTSAGASAVQAACRATPAAGTTKQANNSRQPAPSSPAAGKSSAAASGSTKGQSASSAGASGTPAGGAGSSTSARSSQAGGTTAAGASGQGSAGAAGAARSAGQGGQGRGSGASGSSGSGQQGQVRTVYVPGSQLQGPGVTESGPTGSTVEVGSPTYRQMVQKYAASANTALGRESLPPGLQSEVKRYFNALQGSR